MMEPIIMLWAKEQSVRIVPESLWIRVPKVKSGVDWDVYCLVMICQGRFDSVRCIEKNIRLTDFVHAFLKDQVTEARKRIETISTELFRANLAKQNSPS
jgi:hypothetical protein